MGELSLFKDDDDDDDDDDEDDDDDDLIWRLNPNGIHCGCR